MSLQDKIINKKFTAFVVGCGYTGLPLAEIISKNNIKTIAYDINKLLIKSLKKNKKYSKINFTDNIKYISKADIILICLPTPLTSNKDPDLSYISNFLESSKNYLKKNQLMILESTTYPGTTKEVLNLFLSKKFKIGYNYFTGYSPERIDPGRKINFENISKICSGTTLKCKKLVGEFYKIFITKVMLVSNNETAEFVKIYENIFRATNISLVNEMKILSNAFGLDINEIINAADTKPYGFMRFNPGPGIGGHCIPVDPFYLTWKAKEFGLHTRFIELAGEINQKMPEWIVSKMIEILNQKKIIISKSKCLILGAAYKKNISDYRESPFFKFVDIFSKFKINFNYHDPWIKRIQYKNKSYKSIPINNVNLKKFDYAILLTDHDDINYKKIEKKFQIIFDTRNRFKNSKNIFKL